MKVLTLEGFQSFLELFKTRLVGRRERNDDGIIQGAEIFNYYEGGNKNIASGNYSHAEGIKTMATNTGAHAEGQSTVASGLRAHAEGIATEAIGDSSHSEGTSTSAQGIYSHAEGFKSIASNNGSHAEGGETKATGSVAHAEGYKTVAEGSRSHAEGGETKATATGSHAEGLETEAKGTYSHVQGAGCIAEGEGSHAEGHMTVAKGKYSHAQGRYTLAESYGGFASGRYNLPKIGSLMEIGNGSGEAEEERSNILEVYPDYINVNGDIRINEVNVNRQFAEMPIPNSSTLNIVVHYIGETNETYTYGDFYKTIQVPDTDPIVYRWEKITYSKQEIDEKLSTIVHLKAANRLPTENISMNTIYFVPKTKTLHGYIDENNQFFVYDDGSGAYLIYRYNTGIYTRSSTAAETIEIDQHIQDGTYTAGTLIISDPQGSNIKDEFIRLYDNSGWEKIGDTEINLENYITKKQYNALEARIRALEERI